MSFTNHFLTKLTKSVNGVSFRRTLYLSSKDCHKVAVLGCSGGVGQPLSLLLKQNINISQLALYDKEYTHGVVADLSHIDTATIVTGHEGPLELEQCLTGSEIVIIPAGVRPKAGMTRGDALVTNGTVVAELSKSLAKYCPNAFICIISDPIESIVPLCSKILKRCGVENTKKVFGITTLTALQARTIVSSEKKLDVDNLQVPVVGGHTRFTIIPLFSQARPPVQFDNFKSYMSMIKRIQLAWVKIFKAKSGMASSTLSMAYAASSFVGSVLEVLNGKPHVVECAYVESNATSAPYFSSSFVFGKNGIEKCLEIGKLSEAEKSLLDECIPKIITSVKRGEEFAGCYHI